MKRNETRKERILLKENSGTFKTFPFEVTTINFHCENNVAFVVRSAACFGFSCVNVIGSIPKYGTLREMSGSTQDCVKINQFSNVNDFLNYKRKNELFLVSAELHENSESLYDFKFPVDKKICIVTGQETYGVPEDILFHSDAIVHIPMNGKGHCLNTSQTATILMNELMRQYNEKK